MIYLTGDTHIPLDIDKLSSKNFPEQKTMTRQDYIIVLGDFGLLWQHNKEYEYWLEIFSSRKYTLLFVDGNHENFDWLNSLPVETWHGGKVHRVAENILHLMRGEIFELQGKTFFAFGGAVSTDRIYRKEGLSWWPEERPNFDEVDHGIKNLMAHENHVDYVLTHTCPATIFPEIQKNVPKRWDPYGDHSVEEALQAIDRDIHYKGWYFGHWHTDFDYEKYHAVYDRVIRLL